MATHLTKIVEEVLQQITNTEEELATIYYDTREISKKDNATLLQQGLKCLIKIRELQNETKQWKEQIVSAEEERLKNTK